MSFNFKKKYGQNFLIDENIIKKIIPINKEKNSLVIEIGPGSGNLTKYLCESFNKVLAYEIDEEVKDILLDNLKKYNNYKIYFNDFMTRDIKSDLKKEHYEKLYVIANLPYYITTPIIEKIIDLNLDIEMIRIMVQKEVGERFSAKPGSKEYGSITVYLNYNYDIKKEFVVSKNSFYPKPNVDSMVVSFIKKEKPYIKNEKEFYRLVRDSFQFKRKTLKNNLKGYNLEKVEKVLKEYGLDLSVRAEELDLEIFCKISNELSI